MQISEEGLNEFIESYEKEFDKPISRQDALEMMIRLITLYQIIYRPLPSEDRRDPGASVPPAE